MIKYILIFLALFFTACINERGVSAKYYNDCNEYYDLQGYYHRDCGDNEIFTYKGVSDGIVDGAEASYDWVLGLDEEDGSNQKNVW